MYTVIWDLLTLFQPTLSIPNVTLFQPTLSIPNVYSNMGFVNIISTNTFNTKCIQ